MKKYLYSLFLLTAIALTYVSCDDNPYKQGHALYDNVCSNCHMEDGSGLEGAIPPLASADYVEEDPLRMACIIRYGQNDTIVVNGRTYDQPMAGIRELTEFQITNIINYINHAWGNDYGVVKLEDVRALLEECDEEIRSR
jgi:mono/diheme cytochrome c family protein